MLWSPPRLSCELADSKTPSSGTTTHIASPIAYIKHNMINNKVCIIKHWPSCPSRIEPVFANWCIILVIHSSVGSRLPHPKPRTPLIICPIRHTGAVRIRAHACVTKDLSTLSLLIHQWLSAACILHSPRHSPVADWND